MSSGNRLENHIRAYLGVPVRTAPSGCSPFQPLRGPPSLRQAQGPRRRLPSLTLRHIRIKRMQKTKKQSFINISVTETLRKRFCNVSVTGSTKTLPSHQKRTMKKQCTCCQADMIGRPDKKYCSQLCRTKAHRATTSQHTKTDIVPYIDTILHKNRQILATLTHKSIEKKILLDKIILERAGFQFQYHTGTYLNKEGKTYHYIYDFTWMLFSNQQMLIIKK